MPNGRCKFHGGKSTGPRTPEGLERSRRANWKHGYYSREAKAERSRVREAPLEREPIDRVRARLEALLKANAAPRCGARSKRTGKPCQGAAMPNGRCKFHGGKSTGPRSGPNPKGKAPPSLWRHCEAICIDQGLRLVGRAPGIKMLDKTEQSDRAPNPNEKPEDCYCSALPKGSGLCLPCYTRWLRGERPSPGK
jgi:hypothetical protein